MSANVFRFRRLPLLCAGMFSAAVSAAQESRVLPDPVVPSSSVQESSVPSSSVQESSVSEFFAPATAVRLSSVPERRPLDSREHRGYTSWKRLLPTHVKAQYAGGMGFLSVGYGWDYGRKCRWETDLMFGVLPKSCSDRTHLTFTLKQNYIPWSIRCRDWLSVEPFSCGAYLNLISGEDFWIREPDRYPGGSILRFHLPDPVSPLCGSARHVPDEARVAASPHHALLRIFGQRSGSCGEVREPDAVLHGHRILFCRDQVSAFRDVSLIRRIGFVSRILMFCPLFMRNI